MARAAFESTNDGSSARLISALSGVLDFAIAVARAHGGSFQLCDRSDGSLRLIATRGFTAEAALFFRVIKDDKSACHAAMKRARQTVVSDVRTSELYTEPARRVMLRSRLHACQSTPIRGRDGGVIGMMSTHFHAPHRPTVKQLRRITVLARHAAALIEHRPAPVRVSDVSTIIEQYRSTKSEMIRATGR